MALERGRLEVVPEEQRRHAPPEDVRHPAPAQQHLVQRYGDSHPLFGVQYVEQLRHAALHLPLQPLQRWSQSVRYAYARPTRSGRPRPSTTRLRVQIQEVLPAEEVFASRRQDFSFLAVRYSLIKETRVGIVDSVADHAGGLCVGMFLGTAHAGDVHHSPAVGLEIVRNK